MLNDDNRWISFHGSFDYAYLLKLLLGTKIPNNVKDFYDSIGYFFPNNIDIKYMINDIGDLKYCGL